ncbi:caspase recruitment domain-containing protein 19 [Crocuta crocuta]
MAEQEAGQPTPRFLLPASSSPQARPGPVSRDPAGLLPVTCTGGSGSGSLVRPGLWSHGTAGQAGDRSLVTVQPGLRDLGAVAAPNRRQQGRASVGSELRALALVDTPGTHGTDASRLSGPGRIQKLEIHISEGKISQEEVATADREQTYCDRLVQDAPFLMGHGRLSEQQVDRIILQLNRYYPQILSNSDAEKFRNPKASLRMRLCDLLGHLQRSGERDCQEFYRALYIHAQPLHSRLPSRLAPQNSDCTELDSGTEGHELSDRGPVAFLACLGLAAGLALLVYCSPPGGCRPARPEHRATWPPRASVSWPVQWDSSGAQPAGTGRGGSVGASGMHQRREAGCSQGSGGPCPAWGPEQGTPLWPHVTALTTGRGAPAARHAPGVCSTPIIFILGTLAYPFSWGVYACLTCQPQAQDPNVDTFPVDTGGAPAPDQFLCELQRRDWRPPSHRPARPGVWALHPLWTLTPGVPEVLELSPRGSAARVLSLL